MTVSRQEPGLQSRFAVVSTRLTRAVQVSGIGDNIIVPTTNLQRIKLYWVGMSSSQDNSAEVLAIVKIGTNVLYRWRMGNPGAFAHFEMQQGALDEDLILNLSAAGQPVEFNYTYEVI